MGNTSHQCSFCGSVNRSEPPTVGDCQGALSAKGIKLCSSSVNGVCPKGTGPCSQQGFAASVGITSGHPGGISGGNSQSIFPAFPADAVGTNSSLAGVAAATVIDAKSWSQGNSFTKAFSAAARVVGPGLLNATKVFDYWQSTMEGTQQPNGIPFNPFSGFETIGSTEYVNFMMLQSDSGYRDPVTNKASGRFIGLFEAMPPMNAAFTKLRARGAFVVSSSYSTAVETGALSAGGGAGSGKVGPTTILSERGVMCVVRRPQSWSKAAVVVTVASTGAAAVVSWQGGGGAEFFSFPTASGQTYSVHG